MADTLSNSPPKRLLHVFLCHSSSDKPAVRELYRRLRSEGIDPWLDEEKLLGGQDFSQEIAKAVRSSDVVVVCLSRTSINKAGYVQKEIRIALDVADEQPEGAIFVIPLKLEECDIPERLSRWHWVNFFAKDGYDRLMLALRHRASELDIQISSTPRERGSPRNRPMLLFIAAIIGAFGIISFGTSLVFLSRNGSPTPQPPTQVAQLTAPATSTAILATTVPASISPVFTPATPTQIVAPSREVSATATSTATLTAIPISAFGVPQKRLDNTDPSNRYNSGLFVVDLVTGSPTKISGEIPASAVWSPNGKKILISSSWVYCNVGNGFDSCYYWGVGGYGAALRVMDDNGDNTVELVKSGPPESVDVAISGFLDAIWSLDGKRVFFRRSYKSDFGVFSIGSDGTGIKRLDSSDISDWPRYLSVDGKWVIAISSKDNSLYALELDGNRRVPLSQIGNLEVYNERYYPWLATDKPNCSLPSKWGVPQWLGSSPAIEGTFWYCQ